MDIFVTGATGVLGRTVVPHLVHAQHRVRGLARSADKSTLLRNMGAEPIHADLFDPTAVAHAVEGCKVILHLATHIPAIAETGKKEAWRENDRIRIEGTRILVNAALAHHVTTILYPSICFVYPDSGDTWIDATNCEPTVADFNRSTFDAEREIQRFSAAGGRGIVLRLGLLYGPDSPQSHEQVKYAKKGIATVPGQPAAYHPFLWIPDAGRAVVAGMDHAPAGIFDVVDDSPATTQELSLAMAAAVGKKHLWALPQFLMRMMIGATIVDAMSHSQRVSNRRFKEITGWQPQLANPHAGWAQIARGITNETSTSQGGAA